MNIFYKTLTAPLGFTRQYSPGLVVSRDKKYLAYVLFQVPSQGFSSF